MVSSDDQLKSNFIFDLFFCRLSVKCPANYVINEQRHCECGGFRWRAKGPSVQSTEKWKRDSLFIDKRGKLRNFDHKKVSRKRSKDQLIQLLCS